RAASRAVASFRYGRQATPFACTHRSPRARPRRGKAPHSARAPVPARARGNARAPHRGRDGGRHRGQGRVARVPRVRRPCPRPEPRSADDSGGAPARSARAVHRMRSRTLALVSPRSESPSLTNAVRVPSTRARALLFPRGEGASGELAVLRVRFVTQRGSRVVSWPAFRHGARRAFGHGLRTPSLPPFRGGARGVPRAVGQPRHGVTPRARHAVSTRGGKRRPRSRLGPSVDPSHAACWPARNPRALRGGGRSRA